jgi:hypothetical protein
MMSISTILVSERGRWGPELDPQMTQIAQILIIGRTDIFVCHSLRVNACPAFQRDELEPEREPNVAPTVPPLSGIAERIGSEE